MLKQRELYSRVIAEGICGLICLCAGCATQNNATVCLRNACTGFVFWPVPERIGASINIGCDTLTLTALSPEDRKTIERLKDNRVSFDARDSCIEAFAERLNEAQRRQCPPGMPVNVRVNLPASWDAVLVFDDATAMRMGYDKGFETSARKYMPAVKVSAHDESVYGILERLCEDWPPGVCFSISRGEVILGVRAFKMEAAYHAEGL
jgi:hypothetical protein